MRVVVYHFRNGRSSAACSRATIGRTLRYNPVTFQITSLFKVQATLLPYFPPHPRTQQRNSVLLGLSGR